VSEGKKHFESFWINESGGSHRVKGLRAKTYLEGQQSRGGIVHSMNKSGREQGGGKILKSEELILSSPGVHRKTNVVLWTCSSSLRGKGREIRALIRRAINRVLAPKGSQKVRRAP